MILLLSNTFSLGGDPSILFNRITILALIYCILQDIASLSFINKAVGLHADLFNITNITQILSYKTSVSLKLIIFFLDKIREVKYLFFNILIIIFHEYINIITNIFTKDGSESFFNKIDSLLSLI